jgi:UDP-N-acetylmuramoyl-L-alanyl-D-glutamate--2,6-diaminopimelate ligase
MALLSRRFYRKPDSKLKVIGVTGTNGKTTVTYIITNLLRDMGMCGRLGTLTYFNGLSEERASRTTPEASDIFRSLGEMVSNGCSYAAIEVSSHGLTYERVFGLELHYAIFTNLSRDHLDFHGDMESYFEAKQKLFEHLIETNGYAIINQDDAFGRRIQIPNAANVIRYGTSADVDLRFEVETLDFKGARFRISYKGQTQVFQIPLLGRHNIYNFTAALAVALCEGRTLTELAEVARRIRAVPGRTEILDLNQPFGMIIDFAHSPDALYNVLTACRHIAKERLIVVFGAGGDRDRSKREEMGAAVDQHADIILLTSDNPRNEDPESIMDMIQRGIKRQPGGNFQRIWDREQAIKTAIDLAAPGDLILIAGKGHESFQEIQGKLEPFDDRVIASRYLLTKLGRKEHV